MKRNTSLIGLVIILQIMAYLKLFIPFNKSNEKDENQIILDDINNSIVSFCSILSSTKSTFNLEYEEKMQKATKEIINYFCLKCSNKAFCFAGKKYKTYAFIRNSLLNINTSNNMKFKWVRSSKLILV